MNINIELFLDQVDSTVSELAEGSVIPGHCAQTQEIEYLHAIAGTLTEWMSLADENAYLDL